MHFHHFLAAVSLATLISAEALRALPRADPLPLPSADPTWTGSAFDGGEDVQEFTGSAESFIEHLKAVNPDWQPGFSRGNHTLNDNMKRNMDTTVRFRGSLTEPSSVHR